MDWSGLGETLASTGLKVLGGALLGPAGGAVGALVSNALGLDDGATPDEVKAAFDADPDGAAAKLRLLEEQNRHTIEVMELKAQMASIAEVNRTARVEAKSDDAYVRRARPTNIYLTGGIVFIMAATGTATVFVAPDQLNSLGDLYQALQWPLSILAGVGGFYVQARSRDKAVSAGHPPQPGLLSALASRFAK